MSAEIQVNVMMQYANPSTGAGWTDGIQPQQISVTQTTLGQTSDITSIGAAVAGTVVQGTTWKPSATAGTTTTLPACTYANGASGVGATLTGDANGALSAQDGITLAINQTLLVKNQAAGLQNGLYVVTAVGDGSNPYVLTRHTAMDTTLEFVDSVIYVASGSTLGGQIWNCTNASAPTIGVTSITFGQSAAGTAINYGSVATLGYLYVKNLDTTNFIRWGPSVGGYMQRVGRLKALEHAVFRMDQNPTLRFLADTNTCRVGWKLFSE